MTRPPDPKGYLTLRVPIMDYGDYGPAMRALPSDRQRAFVIAFLQSGGQNATEAARQAGYEDSKATRITATRLAHDTAVQAAMLEESQRMLGAHLPLSTAFLVKVLSDDSPSVAMKDKLKAVDMIMTRTGMPAQTEHRVTVEHKMSEDQVKQRVLELAQKHGIPIENLLGSDVIEGEFTEVPQPEEDWTAL